MWAFFARQREPEAEVEVTPPPPSPSPMVVAVEPQPLVAIFVERQQDAVFVPMELDVNDGSDFFAVREAVAKHIGSPPGNTASLRVERSAAGAQVMWYGVSPTRNSECALIMNYDGAGHFASGVADVFTGTDVVWPEVVQEPGFLPLQPVKRQRRSGRKAK